MFLPYRADYAHQPDCEQRMPVANLALICTISAVTVLAWLRLLTPESLILFRDGGAPVAYVTHAFVHADSLHLLGNVVCLFAFGNALNRRLGHGLYLALALVLCVAGGAAWMVFGHGHGVVGASGLALGLGGFFVVVFPRLPLSVLVPLMPIVWFAITGGIELVYGVRYRMPAHAVVIALQLRYLFGVSSALSGPSAGPLLSFLGFRSWNVAGLWVAPVLVLGDIAALLWSSADGVAHSAHIAGALVGFGLALALCLAGVVRGNSHLPTLIEWIRGSTSAPLPSDTQARPRAAETRRRTRSLTRVSFADWRRRQQQVAVTSGTGPVEP